MGMGMGKLKCNVRMGMWIIFLILGYNGPSTKGSSDII